jgi:hypothetical protein
MACDNKTAQIGKDCEVKGTRYDSVRSDVESDSPLLLPTSVVPPMCDYGNIADRRKRSGIRTLNKATRVWHAKWG